MCVWVWVGGCSPVDNLICLETERARGGGIAWPVEQLLLGATLSAYCSGNAAGLRSRRWAQVQVFPTVAAEPHTTFTCSARPCAI